MSYPQEKRINQNLDSQVKRQLARAIEFESTKNHFHKMMAAMQVLLDNERNRDLETVEEFIEASKHSVSMGGQKYHSYSLEEWVTEQYKK